MNFILDKSKLEDKILKVEAQAFQAFEHTTVLLPCLGMLQIVSRSYKGQQISQNLVTNEEVKFNLLTDPV